MLTLSKSLGSDHEVLFDATFLPNVFVTRKIITLKSDISIRWN